MAVTAQQLSAERMRDFPCREKSESNRSVAEQSMEYKCKLDKPRPSPWKLQIEFVASKFRYVNSNVIRFRYANIPLQSRTP